MKVSQEQKQETRQALIEAAVDLVVEKGATSATMRGIARAAGVADATIYNYFPTKESIYYAYYEGRMAEATDLIRSRPSYAEYSLQERLQALFEELLERFLPDREFVEATYKAVLFAMPPDRALIKPVHDHFFSYVEEALDAAVERGEMEDQIFKDMIVRFYWDHFSGILVYWLRDRSELFADTSILADKTLGLGAAALRAGMANRVFDICSFLFRNHVLSFFEGNRDRVDSLRRIGKAFMSGDYGAGEHGEEGHGRSDS